MISPNPRKNKPMIVSSARFAEVFGIAFLCLLMA